MEKGCNRCVDVTAQPLKGKAMPPHRSPCDDYTSTVTPFDPDTPIWPTRNPTSLSLQLLVPIGRRGPLRKGWRRNGWRERERGKEGQGSSEKGAMQKVNCWSEVFIGSAGGRELEWENALKTTVWDFNCREGNLAFFHPYTRLAVRRQALSRPVCQRPNV